MSLGSGKFENGATTGAFGYLFNQLPHEMSADDRAGKVTYSGLRNIRDHLDWLSQTQDGVPLSGNPFMRDSQQMLTRLMMGKSSDYDTAFYHHESAEAALMSSVRALPISNEIVRDSVLQAQSKAHSQVLQTQGNTQYQLYHPSVVHGDATKNLFNNDWKAKVPPVN